MKKGGMYWKLAAIILLMAAIGAAGFLIGRNESASKVQADKELAYGINRSELNGLGEIKGDIYVTGHKSPDTDTVGSAIGYAALLCDLGYDAKPVVLGEINNETRYILETGGLDVPMLLEDASGCNMVLVDHSEYKQSADGLADANVITIIDHHGDGDVTTGNQLIYDARPFGSTATIVWLHYRNYGLEPDQKTACAMMGSILSDTRNLQSDTTTLADREALKELSRLAGISDTDALYLEMYKALISYEGKTDEEIFFSDYKEYESGGKTFSIGSLNAYDEENALDLVERMAGVLPKTLVSTGMDMAFAQINIFHDDLSVTYIVPSDEAAAEVIKDAFGDQAVYDGSSYRIEPCISRKAVSVPAISDALASLLQE